MLRLLPPDPVSAPRTLVPLLGCPSPSPGLWLHPRMHRLRPYAVQDPPPEHSPPFLPGAAAGAYAGQNGSGQAWRSLSRPGKGLGVGNGRGRVRSVVMATESGGPRVPAGCRRMRQPYARSRLAGRHFPYPTGPPEGGVGRQKEGSRRVSWVKKPKQVLEPTGPRIQQSPQHILSYLLQAFLIPPALAHSPPPARRSLPFIAKTSFSLSHR